MTTVHQHETVPAAGAGLRRAAHAGSDGRSYLVLLMPESQPRAPEPRRPGSPGEAGTQVLAWDLEGEGPPSKQKSASADGMTPELFRMLKSMVADQTPAAGDRRPHWAAVLRLSEPEAGPQAASARIVEQAREFVELNLQKPLTLRQAAAETGVCMQHFCRVFSEQTGMPFKKYVARQRAARALELLRTTSRSIKEIAYEVGFGSIAQFNRQFKRWHGAPPSSMKRE